MLKVKENKGLWGSLVAMLLTMVINAIIPFQSTFIERYYSHGIFKGFRFLWDYTVGWIPIPLIYLLLSCIGIYLFRSFWIGKTKKKRWFLFGKRLIIAICLLITSFYWMWGFNYKRADLRETLGLKDISLEVEDIYAEYALVSDSLNALRAQLPQEMAWETYQVDQSQLRKDLKKAYKVIGLDYSGRVRIRQLYPKGSLLYISTAGVYLPFVGEGHIDPGLHPLTHPFTMMHEMSHGYGWTGEDVCNFLALIAAVNSEDVITRYSGYLGYWRYLRSNAYRGDPQRWKDQERLISDAVLKDYQEVIEYTDRYPDIMPKLRNLIYDTYLKSHGIPEGIVSYSEMVQLALGWQDLHGSFQLIDLSNDIAD